jgi:ribosomal protection tetracycline resistance protein
VSTLNLGIVAHVDAGKTSLTERLLYAAGVIAEPGSVDAGSTQTDSLALERQRGITIKSAVVSFAIGDRTVNLIDTPGHPDFIAEVERVLGVLDGAVLVLSAVEGVQAQTRILMRTLRRLRIPTLLFVNKIDRRGADQQRVVRDIADRLTPAVIALGTVSGPGTRDARYVPYTAAEPAFTSRLVELLAEHDDALLAAYVDDEPAVPFRRLRAALAGQTARSLVHPVLFGSAITGAGVEALMAAIRELLPAAGTDAGAPAAGTVFKVERGAAGEKIAYVRMFAGTLAVRDRVGGGDKVTAIRVFDNGVAAPRTAVTAGQIGKLWGLAGVRIGDALGEPRTTADGHYFPPPTLATVVTPSRPGDKGALRDALTQLAEQDPLINVRLDDLDRELSVSLYGEVQKEVIEATLAAEYGIEVSFRESTTICVERPAGAGEAVAFLNTESNPFQATIGLRIQPAPPSSGIAFRLAIDPRTVPLYVYKDLDSFRVAMNGYVRDALHEGLSGWQVTDCLVTMIRCGYSVADGPPSLRGPRSTAADFRKLTPMVVAAALRHAGTHVYEPIHRFHVEIPADTLGAVLPALAKLDAIAHATDVRGSTCTLEGDVPAARTYLLQQRLPALTRGEGLLESAFDHYRPVRATTR